ncbi:hypothetical protein EGR_10145 [Echinococcus granulosus]|uniref:Uncharacterized protein n=1 Tax=Echinococcus granulosus TaxID=6210 RepID=W6U1T7_ECHGR|nr:hypothetical protein EGR_10145 [Echinococcus granulosus]EUB55003.1 hypothetical protein EGR_10145 [Echinococcus granulosus]
MKRALIELFPKHCMIHLDDILILMNFKCTIFLNKNDVLLYSNVAEQLCTITSTLRLMTQHKYLKFLIKGDHV